MSVGSISSEARAGDGGAIAARRDWRARIWGPGRRRDRRTLSDRPTSMTTTATCRCIGIAGAPIATIPTRLTAMMIATITTHPIAIITATIHGTGTGTGTAPGTTIDTRLQLRRRCAQEFAQRRHLAIPQRRRGRAWMGRDPQPALHPRPRRLEHAIRGRNACVTTAD